MSDDLESRAPAWVRFEPPLMLEGGHLDPLVARAIPGARAVRVEFLDGGVVNSNYRVDLVADDPARSVPATVHLRLSRSDEAPLREGLLADLLSELPGAVPRLILSERGERPEPHRRSLFEWIDGVTLEDSPADDAALGQAAEGLACFLAALPCPGRGRFGRFGTDLAVAGDAERWPDDLTRRVGSRLESPALALSPAETERVRTAFARRLAPLWSAAPVTARLVHGDLSPGNIILGAGPRPEEPAFAGLIDWETARAADPVTDIASARFELGGRWPRFVAALEKAYRARALPDIDDDAWNRRVSLAALPMLLDARMVAVRRGDPAVLAGVDAALGEALGNGNG